MGELVFCTYILSRCARTAVSFEPVGCLLRSKDVLKTYIWDVGIKM